MFIDLKGGRVLDTDYFSSRDCERGIPWCVADTGIWHVLTSRTTACPPSLVKARPVTAMDEPDRWRWRLELPGLQLPLYARCFRPRRPSLPEPNTRHQRTVVFYHRQMSEERAASSSFFGSIPIGMQVWCVSNLWVERIKDMRAEHREHD